ncbi:MAG TPA: TRAP transporter large permease subunit [Xanthobacteraceae bacterium]
MGRRVRLFRVIMAVKRSIDRHMPPFGLNLFVARAIFKAPMGMIYRSILPFVVVNFTALVITYVPAMLLLGSAC